MSPLKVNDDDKNGIDSKPEEVPRDSAVSANELNQSVPVSAADDAEDEDYFVVEGNESDDEKDNIQKALSARDREEAEEVKMVEDPKVKASAILKSVFGEDAEDAVSYEGGLSEGEDAVSEEMVEMIGTSTSVVEETYSVGENDDNNNDKVRNSLPF